MLLLLRLLVLVIIEKLSSTILLYLLEALLFLKKLESLSKIVINLSWELQVKLKLPKKILSFLKEMVIGKYDVIQRCNERES